MQLRVECAPCVIFHLFHRGEDVWVTELSDVEKDSSTTGYYMDSYKRGGNYFFI